MINNTDLNENPDFSAEGNSPRSSANEGSLDGESKLSVGKLKSYGKKSLSPLVELVHKYQDEITPYFDAISKGLQGGVDSLSRTSSGSSTSSISDTSTGETASFVSGVSTSNGSSDSSGTEAERVVAGWFREAADGLNEARTKLQSSNTQDMIDYIEVQARNHPGFMFSSSYLAGLFFGRIGKHIGRKKFSQSSSSSSSSSGLDASASWNSGDSMTH
ncbi:MAG TPA: hypothetical protein VNJ08_07920 [Bacteriovoracaceae bacterium]|nr:hypothetical protein [Bacteriovoracaceae bacterium]